MPAGTVYVALLTALTNNTATGVGAAELELEELERALELELTPALEELEMTRELELELTPALEELELTRELELELEELAHPSYTSVLPR